MQVQEIRASAGSQWGCPSIGVIYGQLEVHGLQAELRSGLPDVYKWRDEEDPSDTDYKVVKALEYF